MIGRTLTIARKELIHIVRDGKTLVVDLLLDGIRVRKS